MYCQNMRCECYSFEGLVVFLYTYTIYKYGFRFQILGDISDYLISQPVVRGTMVMDKIKVALTAIFF